MIKVILLGCALMACSKSDKTSDKDDKPTASAPHEEHEQMSPELGKFHDVLAPHWHAEAGAKRQADTCAAIGEFRAAAGPVGAKRLSEAVEALDAACKAGDAGRFDAAFARVHEAFHAQLEHGK